MSMLPMSASTRASRLLRLLLAHVALVLVLATASCALVSARAEHRAIANAAPSGAAAASPAQVDLSAHPFPYEAVRGQAYNVSSDERAITINGQRVLLQSGIIHYPRATPAMWPALLRRLKQAHLNTVQTYIFWNFHELQRGQWDFASDSRNLSHFLHLAAAEGLFVNLRLGPYVCAEFAHGGLPHYLKAVDGLVFRAYNAAWLNATRYYLETMSRYLQPHLPGRGGNVILAQVENEYGDTKPNAYIEWLSALAVELSARMGIVFYVNNQPNAPLSVLAARDTYNPIEENYINGTTRPRHQPALVVESYTGCQPRTS